MGVLCRTSTTAVGTSGVCTLLYNQVRMISGTWWQVTWNQAPVRTSTATLSAALNFLKFTCAGVEKPRSSYAWEEEMLVLLLLLFLVLSVTSTVGGDGGTYYQVPGVNITGVHS